MSIKLIYFLRLGLSFLHLWTNKWFLQHRLSTIVLRSHEHGFLKYFQSVSKRTVKQTAMETHSNTLKQNTVVADAGGLQEILLACYIYLLGMACGIFTFALEYFFMKNSQ